MESRRNILGAPIVPDRSMKKISELCQIIGKHKTPVYIPSLPETKIERHYCTRAVNQKIMRDGGKACSGWIIWQWANIVLEASAYVVWQDGSGNLIDVTPKENYYEKVLFIPALASNESELGNKRIPLTDSILARELIEIANKCEILLQIDESGEKADKEYVQSILLPYKRRKDEIIRLISQKVGRNDPCPCGSGIKFKKCCGYYE